MSHRKYEHPRSGSLGFLPRKRCRRGRGKIKHFPNDDVSKPSHLTAFMGFKSGMTHVIRKVEKPGSRADKEESCEPVTIIEAPPMVVVGIVGYVSTPHGLRSLNTVFAEHLSEEVRRRFYKNWYRSKNKAFTKYVKKYAEKNKTIEAELENLKKSCNVVRALCHTQVHKIPNLGQKRAHLMEIQVNGGSVTDRVNLVHDLFEKEVSLDGVFRLNEMIDVISITKGNGFEGVIKRTGVTRLPRKTHRGLRKVACVGAWHPSAVKWTVGRAGQKGFSHRTELNKKIYRIGKVGQNSHTASTEYDITNKGITPLGAFPHYGIVKNDFLILKGTIPGPVCRAVTLRLSLFNQSSRTALSQVCLKFIDTSSKFGKGRFQTSHEKLQYIGPQKKHEEQARSLAH